MVCLTLGHWVDGELSIGVERPLTCLEDEKNICATEISTLTPTLSFSSVIFLQPFGQQNRTIARFVQASLLSVHFIDVINMSEYTSNACQLFVYFQ